ncbi:hypothetical protein GEMRC1_004491 [Eukaryota sp. GEM-RC1]
MYDLFSMKSSESSLIVGNSSMTSSFFTKAINHTNRFSNGFCPVKIDLPDFSCHVTTSCFDQNPTGTIRFMIALVDGTVAYSVCNIDLSTDSNSEFVIQNPSKIHVNVSELISSIHWNSQEVIFGDVTGCFHLVSFKEKSTHSVPFAAKKPSLVRTIRVTGDLQSNFISATCTGDGQVTILTPDKIKKPNPTEKKSNNDFSAFLDDDATVAVLPAEIARLPRAVDVRFVDAHSSRGIESSFAVLLAVDSSVRIVPCSLEACKPPMLKPGYFLLRPKRDQWKILNNLALKLMQGVKSSSHNTFCSIDLFNFYPIKVSDCELFSSIVVAPDDKSFSSFFLVSLIVVHLWVIFGGFLPVI